MPYGRRQEARTCECMKRLWKMSETGGRSPEGGNPGQTGSQHSRQRSYPREYQRHRPQYRHPGLLQPTANKHLGEEENGLQRLGRMGVLAVIDMGMHDDYTVHHMRVAEQCNASQVHHKHQKEEIAEPPDGSFLLCQWNVQRMVCFGLQIY